LLVSGFAIDIGSVWRRGDLSLLDLELDKVLLLVWSGVV
jgi:hypothetical protein